MKTFITSLAALLIVFTSANSGCTHTDSCAGQIIVGPAGYEPSGQMIQNRAIRMKLYEAFAFKGDFHASARHPGTEGGWITHEIIIRSGHVTVIHDHTKDRFGAKAIIRYSVPSIELVDAVSGRLITLPDAADVSVKLVICYELPGSGRWKF